MTIRLWGEHHRHRACLKSSSRSPIHVLKGDVAAGGEAHICRVEAGKPIEQVAGDLGANEVTLGNWCSKAPRSGSRCAVE